MLIRGRTPTFNCHLHAGHSIVHDDLLLGDFMGEKDRVLCGRRTYGLEVVTDTEPSLDESAKKHEWTVRPSSVQAGLEGSLLS